MTQKQRLLFNAYLLITVYALIPLNTFCVGEKENKRHYRYEKPDSIDRYGKTQLHRAVEKRDLDWVVWLLTNGADPNSRDSYGRSPLHAAAWNNGLDIAEQLLKKGACANEVDGDKNSPLRLAQNRKHLKMIKVLTHTTNTNTRNIDDNRQHHSATARGGDAYKIRQVLPAQICKPQTHPLIASTHQGMCTPNPHNHPLKYVLRNMLAHHQLTAVVTPS